MASLVAHMHGDPKLFLLQIFAQLIVKHAFHAENNLWNNLFATMRVPMPITFLVILATLALDFGDSFSGLPLLG
jgi:hypothetical protein